MSGLSGAYLGCLVLGGGVGCMAGDSILFCYPMSVQCRSSASGPLEVIGFEGSAKAGVHVTDPYYPVAPRDHIR